MVLVRFLCDSRGSLLPHPWAQATFSDVKDSRIRTASHNCPRRTPQIDDINILYSCPLLARATRLTTFRFAILFWLASTKSGGLRSYDRIVEAKKIHLPTIIAKARG